MHPHNPQRFACAFPDPIGRFEGNSWPSPVKLRSLVGLLQGESDDQYSVYALLQTRGWFSFNNKVNNVKINQHLEKFIACVHIVFFMFSTCHLKSIWYKKFKLLHLSLYFVYCLWTFSSNAESLNCYRLVRTSTSSIWSPEVCIPERPFEVCPPAWRQPGWQNWISILFAGSAITSLQVSITIITI